MLDTEKLKFFAEAHPRCKTCIFYDTDSGAPQDDFGYCEKFSRGGEEPEQNSEAAYDNFWVGSDFYCPQYERKS